MLEARGLDLGYGNARSGYHVVARGLSMQLHPGELVCLVGPNGAGKSTLMRTLAGMQPALAGQVLLDGADLHRISARERARRLSVVLTDNAAAGLLDVEAVVGLGRTPHTGWTGRLNAEDRRVVRWAIDAVGIEDFLRRPFSELSDGERQKVMIARALAQQPRVLILDEITAFLDLPRRVQIMRLLRDLVHTSERAILLSTHDLDLALRSADVVWLLPKDGPLATGSPEDLVLRGDFETVFEQEGVRFDRESGSFRILDRTGSEIRLAGRGLAAAWTTRALQREGFHVSAEEASAGRSPSPGSVPLVEVTAEESSSPRWTLIDDRARHEFASLVELTRSLRARQHARSPEGASLEVLRHHDQKRT